jgi:hypothetical protein
VLSRVTRREGVWTLPDQIKCHFCFGHYSSNQSQKTVLESFRFYPRFKSSVNLSRTQKSPNFPENLHSYLNVRSSTSDCGKCVSPNFSVFNFLSSLFSISTTMGFVNLVPLICVVVFQFILWVSVDLMNPIKRQSETTTRLR